ncbi:hypothetical protein GOP47_0028598 [Adiantum capillus-veneris]|nr:hypothetical protein GOP47_0028598 [Adiantum capillus-veneris]
MFLCATPCRSPLLARTHHQYRSSPWPSPEVPVPRLLSARAQTQEGDGGGSSSSNEQPKKPPALMSALERAAAYKKSLDKSKPSSTDQDSPVEGKPSSDSNDQQPSEADNVLLDFKALKSKQESEMASALAAAQAEARKPGGVQDDSNSQGIEVEIITRDGVIRRKVSKPGESFSKFKGPKRIGISSSDFMGLDFSEKKSTSKSARPAGLTAGFESPPPGSLPEVEIITRDGTTQQSSKDGLYKPKVVTWGVFERPADISRTYGGGRTIKPGEQLETEEEKRARNARTKEILAAYYKKVGLDVDPTIKAECTKALKQGSELFEKGYLQSAIDQFEKVMQQMPYQSELHGLAALQRAVCLDSSNRFEEARALYEKIASHPNFTVRKKAKQLLYGFKAMDNLKVSIGSRWDTSMYSKYFGAFSDGYNTMYKPSEQELDEGRLENQAAVYIGVLLFPLVLLFLVIALKGR